MTTTLRKMIEQSNYSANNVGSYSQ